MYIAAPYSIQYFDYCGVTEIVTIEVPINPFCFAIDYVSVEHFNDGQSLVSWTCTVAHIVWDLTFITTEKMWHPQMERDHGLCVYVWQDRAFSQSLSKCDTGSNRSWMLCCAEKISSVTAIARVCVRVHMCVSAPPAPNCVCVASLVWCRVWEQAGCRRRLPLKHSPHKARWAQPSPALPRISKGAVSKSNRTLLHRIPLVTQFRFMQAHSVGHFHSFRKRGQASFSLQNPAAFIGKSVYLHFVLQFISVEGDIKREMQVRHYPEKGRAVALLFRFLSTSFIFLSGENKCSAVCHCHCPFFHLYSRRYSTSHQMFNKTHSWNTGE